MGLGMGLNYLDSKLKENLLVLVKVSYEYGKRDGQGSLERFIEPHVAQIKQVFADEGYRYVPHVRLTSPDLSDYMTGQEWYDRFEKELGQNQEYDTLIDFDAKHPESTHYYKHINEAARKAAGL